MSNQLPTVEQLTDKIADMLHGTYHCNRVWNAWNVGTMSERDFSPVDESDTPSEIAVEIAAMLPTQCAVVPLHMTQPMIDVVDADGWVWGDLLAAANAVTEDQYEASFGDAPQQQSLPINKAGLPYEFIPLQPPREGVPLEGIFLRLWQDLMLSRPHDWESSLSLTKLADQRAASVAASFIVFMGCNGGRDFTEEAERLASTAQFAFARENAFIAVWAIQNQRRSWVNNNIRRVEFVLADARIADQWRVSWERVPTITMDDHDVIDSMVRWWSTPQAGDLRKAAMAEYEALRQRERLLNNDIAKDD